MSYKVVDGISYNVNTPDGVIKILGDAIKYRKRLRLFLGDSETGRDWMEEYDIIGYIGRSTGDVRVPLLISSKSSSGGGAILTNCIVKITCNKQVVYIHPKYNLAKLTTKIIPGEYTEVYADDEVQARFPALDKADKYISFLKGERNIK